MIFGKKQQQRVEPDAVAFKELQTILDGLQAFCVSTGAKSAAKDLKIPSDVLKPHAGKSVPVFCSETRTRLNQEAGKPKRRRTAPGVKRSGILNDNAIRDHVAQLRNADADPQAFDAAFARLKSDKSIKSSDTAEIARQYANSVTKYKSIAAAHADVSKAFVQQARFANKLL
jgi:hypothetical protein